MGSTIYTQNLKHPVYVSYTCEHCGQVNTYSQEIVGNASAEVSFGTSNKYAQKKVSQLGAKAESDLGRQIQKAQNDTENGRYTWLRVHKCSKCKYPQSWQKGAMWRRSFLIIFLNIFYLFIFFNWATGSAGAAKTAGSWSAFIIVGILLFLPILKLILNLRKIGKVNHEKPIVII